jgi:hypothetical protein
LAGVVALAAAWLAGAAQAQPPEFNCQAKPDGNYPDAADCHSFLVCAAGSKYVIACPEGLAYDPRAGSKEHPGECVPASAQLCPASPIPDAARR